MCIVFLGVSLVSLGLSIYAVLKVREQSEPRSQAQDSGTTPQRPK